MSDRNDEPVDQPSRTPADGGAGRPGPQDSIHHVQYDPRVPDELRLQEHEKADPNYLNTPEGRAEAAETTRGEELRPKDDSLDPSSAR